MKIMIHSQKKSVFICFDLYENDTIPRNKIHCITAILISATSKQEKQIATRHTKHLANTFLFHIYMYIYNQKTLIGIKYLTYIKVNLTTCSLSQREPSFPKQISSKFTYNDLATQISDRTLTACTQGCVSLKESKLMYQVHAAILQLIIELYVETSCFYVKHLPGLLSFTQQ